MLRCPMCFSRQVKVTGKAVNERQFVIECQCETCGGTWAMVTDNDPPRDTDKKPPSHKRR